MTKFDIAKERATLVEGLSSPEALPEELLLPKNFDLRGAALRAFDFFTDNTPKGQVERKKLAAEIPDDPATS